MTTPSFFPVRLGLLRSALQSLDRPPDDYLVVGDAAAAMLKERTAQRVNKDRGDTRGIHWEYLAPEPTIWHYPDCNGKGSGDKAGRPMRKAWSVDGVAVWSGVCESAEAAAENLAIVRAGAADPWSVELAAWELLRDAVWALDPECVAPYDDRLIGGAWTDTCPTSDEAACERWRPAPTPVVLPTAMFAGKGPFGAVVEALVVGDVKEPSVQVLAENQYKWVIERPFVVWFSSPSVA